MYNKNYTNTEEGEIKSIMGIKEHSTGKVRFNCPEMSKGASRLQKQLADTHMDHESDGGQPPRRPSRKALRSWKFNLSGMQLEGSRSPVGHDSHHVSSGWT